VSNDGSTDTSAGSSSNDPRGAAGAAREVLSLIHHHPGRLRVRAIALRSGDTAARVLTALEAEPGIVAVSHTPRTGSLLVEYQPGLADSEAILARIAAVSGLDLPSGAERNPRVEPGIVAIAAARELNTLVHELTGYRTDLRTIVPLGMAALSAYSLVVGKDPLPRWDNLLYWSYNIFSQLHHREIEAARAAAAGSSSKPAP
jgi:hypothetical protein